MDIKRLNELQQTFKPYDKDFSHDEWLEEVRKAMGREKPLEEMCSDSFYDDACLGWFIMGVERRGKDILAKLKEGERELEKDIAELIDVQRKECQECKDDSASICTIHFLKMREFRSALTENRKIQEILKQ